MSLLNDQLADFCEPLFPLIVKIPLVEIPAKILQQVPITRSCRVLQKVLELCAGSYRMLCRILKDPVGPFKDFL